MIPPNFKLYCILQIFPECRICVDKIFICISESNKMTFQTILAYYIMAVKIVLFVKRYEQNTQNTIFAMFIYRVYNRILFYHTVVCYDKKIHIFYNINK